MAIPVLIPARNEAAHIATTLESLPEEAEPFVIPNGCTDDTAKIAEDLGATVLYSPELGKLPALQFAIRCLGERALKPFVCLDGDSRPQFPNEWLGALLEARAELDPQKPAIITGSYVAEGPYPVRIAFQNLYYSWRTRRHYTEPDAAISGTNMLFDLQREDVVHAIQELPNIWPGEDSALRDTVVRYSGQTANTLNPKARIITDGADRTHSFSTYMQILLRRRQKGTLYEAGAPPNSITYQQFEALHTGGSE